jgi:hypothetical protein
MKFDTLIEQLLHGKAEGMTLEDIAKKHNVGIKELTHQLKLGIKIEHEHTKNNELAKKIAMDHLFEEPDYYTKHNLEKS